MYQEGGTIPLWGRNFLSQEKNSNFFLASEELLDCSSKTPFSGLFGDVAAFYRKKERNFTVFGTFSTLYGVAPSAINFSVERSTIAV